MKRIGKRVGTSLILVLSCWLIFACHAGTEDLDTQAIPTLLPTSSPITLPPLVTKTATSGLPREESLPSAIPTYTSTPHVTPTPNLPESHWMMVLSGHAEYYLARDTRDRGVLLIGGYDTNNHRHVMTKLDKNGGFVWEKVFNPDTFLIVSIDEDRNGNIHLLGITDLENTIDRFVEMEFDEAGNFISEKQFYTSIVHRINRQYGSWAKSYVPIDFDFRPFGFPDDETQVIKLIHESEDGGVIVAGGSWATRRSGCGGFTTKLIGIWIVKFDQEGKILWQRYLRDQVMSTLNILAMDDGGVSFIGQDYTDRHIAWIAKFERNGDVEFWRSYALSSLYSVSKTPEDGFILVGIRDALKISPSGDLIWAKRFMVHDRTLYMHEREQGGYILSGRYTFEGGNYDYVAFLNEDAEIPDCIHLFTREDFSSEHFPPAWMDQSSDLRARPEADPLEELEVISTEFEENMRSSKEMCRYFIPEGQEVLEVTPDAGQAFIPILVETSGIILGGFQDGIWIDAETTRARIIGDEVYTIFDEDAWLWEQVSGSVPIPKEHGRCQGLPSIDLGKDHSWQGVEFAIGGTWDILPRVPDQIPYDSEIYITEISRYLRENGLSRPEIQRPHMYRVDLDDDGVDEVILDAKYKSNESPFVKVGDYSIVLLRRVVGNEVVTIPFLEEINTRDRPGVYPWRYSILNIFDLNGDGKMEIILEGDDWANGRTWVFELGEETVEPVLSIDCMVSDPWWRDDS